MTEVGRSGEPGADRLGPDPAALDRVARGTVLGLTVLVFALAAYLRPDYLDPTQLGTDVSTYLAAGERALGGGSLYALAPGDRPVPIWPPYWTAPLVSPPPIAVPWVVLAAVVPPAVALVGWWLGAFVATALVAAWIVIRGPLWGLVLVLPLSLATAMMAWTGNVNGFLLAATAAVWILGARPGRPSAIAAGAIVAVAAGLKVGPILLLVWLIGQRRWWSVAAAIVVGTAYLAISVAVLGVGSYTEYLEVARSIGGTAGSGYGAGAIAAALGLPDAVAVAMPWVVAGVCAVAVLVLRRRPRISFAIAVAGSVLGLPIARFESLALLLGVLVPWVRLPDRPGEIRSPPARAASVALPLLTALALCAVALSAAQTSRFTVSNRTGTPVTVRVYYHGIPESFGFRVEAQQSGPAWGPLVGAASGPLVVWSATCERLAVLDVPRTGGHLEITSDGAATVTPTGTPGGAAWLPFDPSCAEQPPRSPD